MLKYHENYYKIKANVDEVWDEVLNQDPIEGAHLEVSNHSN
jgi:hypothetical protein